ncbi:hypothetical protein R1flu_019973 [Riccia fluitans]|uniref:RING-type domain-containing protein n=1 Tax=Riccia fluitans TaxID=41844 RepID=A0ABD1ZLL5_9MARC
MNAAFLKLREYAAKRLLFEVWIYVMRSFYERRTTAEGSIDLLTEYAKGRLSEFEREYGRYVTYNADDDNALVQTNGGVDQWIVRRHPRLSCSCYEPQEMQWPCIHVMSWCKGKGEDYLPYVDRIYFQKSLLACYSQAIPPITEQDLVIHITCRAPEAANRRGRARTVRIPNGGGSSRRHREYMYLVQDEARLISSQGPLTAISDQAVGPSTQDVSSEGDTINLPEQFRGGIVCSICQQLKGPSGAYLIATCPHIFHLECLVRTMRQGQVKCPNCRIPFHRDMMRKFYMERIAPLEHAATYFGDPVQLRRSRLILPFLFDCLDRYIIMFEGEMPLEHRKEMLSVYFKEVDTKFPDLVLDAEDRYPGPYDLRAELKHLLSFYLRREIGDREEIADYMQ